MSVVGVLLGVLFCLWPNGSVWGSTPSQQLSASIDEVMDLVSIPAPADSGARWARRNQIFGVMENRFDFSEMARRSLGDYYEQVAEKERAEFELIFSRLVADSFIKSIEPCRGQQVMIVNEKQFGDRHYYVATRCTTDGRSRDLGYLLHEDQGRWLVYDVYINGASLMSGFRSQFRATIREKEFRGLMSMLKAQYQRLDEG